MNSGRGTRALPRVGFPIRTSRDQRMVSSFPGLFAAAHVLLRLLAPRHPPCALRLLIMKNTVVAAMEFSRCARLPAEKTGRGPVSQNSTAWKRRGQRCSRRPGIPDEDCTPVPIAHRARLKSGTELQKQAPDNQHRNGPGTYRSNGSGIPRKEVIQPQLPLRLPCYDFTPITDPTFDGSLPCGLGHRLRVLPTFVV